VKFFAHACATALAVVISVFAISCAAQAYPDRPIRLVIPYPPGGATDIVARSLGQKLNDSLGQQLVIDNRAGGGQLIGTDIVAKAAPNGYTLILITITHSINPSLYAKLPYDSIKDFAPVTLVAISPQILVAHPSLPVKNVGELLAYLRARPGQINYASSGNGAGGHLAMELFKSMAGVQLTHIPYKGAGPALIDLVGGQVKLMFTSPLAALPFVKSGKLTALAMASARRSEAVPDLPTVAESGLPGFEASLWYGVLAPAGTPNAIIVTLHNALTAALKAPDVRERLAAQGVEALGGGAREFQAFMRSETIKWAKVVKFAGIKTD
jgi:tripartite-type tricarboxylate transporter receptor subunit TctC